MTQIWLCNLDVEKKREECHRGNKSSVSSSAPAIDTSDASEVDVSYTSVAAMEEIERWLRNVVPEASGGYVVARWAVLYGGVVCAYDVALSAMLSVPLVAPLPSLAASVGTKSGSKRIFAAADVNAFPSIYDLFDPSLQMWRSPQSRRMVVKLDDVMMERVIAVCEVGEIVEKGLDVVGPKMEDVVLSLAAIALAVPEEREEAEGGDGDEVKGGYPVAHREFVEKIKDNQGKQ
ncbi:uncharacterized protein MONOS_9249 [Monocercomonoides exilis]|uniref:uncharacterized protein n=1 Tax=Monocercomonoides exilis TaxID=2049356 RepID=UPI003559A67A|nr:hypothetical protein MONOS_9249 [Monocercomonoides exilis]|eukprot:MONOS_9249.1-p1 / transcript=MONOS_9249.1 / gene=MONOS_9249 / organism=Monocercomonoides_exilis_PA203 / gene_product=unspecified product / transcript_product=unspecified product / location=Mono_scaffold00374:44798-45538(-) / protein_length=233 / sequence_SO=supercontig / SO=protein_coding / is_pseudo=false